MVTTLIAIPAGCNFNLTIPYTQVSKYRGVNDADQIDDEDELGMTLKDRIAVPMDVYRVNNHDSELDALEHAGNITDGGWAVMTWRYPADFWCRYVRVFRGDRDCGDLLLLKYGELSIPPDEIRGGPGAGPGSCIESARRALDHLDAINS